MVATTDCRLCRADPAFGKPAIDNRLFNILYGDCRISDAQDTGTFTRSGANTARKFRKVVGGMQSIQRCPPLAAVNQVVPFGDQVIYRASISRLTKGHPAIHAAGTLGLQIGWRHLRENLIKIAHALTCFAVGYANTWVFLKSSYLTHD